jgi:hypothetical protein
MMDLSKYFESFNFHDKYTRMPYLCSGSIVEKKVPNQSIRPYGTFFCVRRLDLLQRYIQILVDFGRSVGIHPMKNAKFTSTKTGLLINQWILSNELLIFKGISYKVIGSFPTGGPNHWIESNHRSVAGEWLMKLTGHDGGKRLRKR